MNKLMLAAGAAALAIAAPALAQKGGKGGDHGGHGGGKPAKVERGGGGGGPKADRGGGQRIKAERGTQSVRAERKRDRGEVRGRDRDRPVRAARVERRDDRDRSRGGDRIRSAHRNDEVRISRERERDRDRNIRVVRDVGGDRTRFAGNIGTRGLIDGCPPGLAAKGNGCMPPGQAKKLVGAAVPVALGAALLPSEYRSWYPDNDDYYYRTSGGYLYRIDRDDNLIDALLPLYDDGYYAVGQPYPADYNFYNVPVQYSDYYADNDDWLYRYGDGAIYQVDRSSGLIEGIVALLAGDLGVGSALPTGYDVYNVPLAYRERYYDTPDAWYRYNDGYIYQVDPKTRIIQAVIEALV